METLALINSLAKLAIFVGTSIQELNAGKKTPEQILAAWPKISADIENAFANFRQAGK